MTSNTLEEKLCTLGKEYIYTQSINSFLLLLMSKVEYESKKDNLPFSSAVPEELQTIIKGIYEKIVTLRDTMKNDVETRKNMDTWIQQQKSKLMTIYKSVYSYHAQWNLYALLVGDEIGIRQYEENGASIEDVDLGLLYKDCHAFLTESKETQHQRITEILRCLPMRMTRDKYYDMLYQTLDTILQDQSKQELERTLQIFLSVAAPQSIPNYGTYFPEIAQWMGEKRLMLTHQYDKEELEKVQTDMEQMFEELQEIDLYFSDILQDLYGLQILHLLQFELDDLFDADERYEDLYDTVCDFITGELSELEQESYLEELKTRIEDVLIPRLEEAQSNLTKQSKLISKMEEAPEFSKETEEILAICHMVQQQFFAELHDELFYQSIDDEDLPNATPEERKEQFQNFIDIVRAYFETLPVQTRKQNMQVLLATWPCTVFTVTDIMNMVENAIEQASTNAKKILIVNKIGMVLDEAGFVDANKAPHAHHHHDHDCDCGHTHHHHDHDCGCGHTHHDHDCDCGHHH